MLVEKVQKDAQKVQGYLQRVLMLCYAGDTGVCSCLTILYRT